MERCQLVLRVCNTLKSRALLCVFFLPTLLIFYSVVSGRLPFWPKCPQSFVGLPWPKFAYWGRGSKMPILGVKICKKNSFAPNAPQSDLENVQHLHMWKVKKCPFWGSKMQKCATKMLQMLLGVSYDKCPFGGLKFIYIFFFFQCLQKSFGGLPWPKLAKEIA